MKTHILFMVMLMEVFTGCHDQAKVPSTDNAGSDFSYHRQAWILRDSGAGPDEFIPLQEKAVELVREGRSPDDPVEVLTQMGNFYGSIGDLSRGIKFLQEATDTLERHPDRLASEGEVQLYGDIGNFYTMLGMPQEALEMNTRGIEVSRAMGGELMSDLYRMRANAFSLAGMPDSVMMCLRLGLEAVDNYDTNRDKDELREMIYIEMADYIIIDSPEMYRDSLQWAVDVLEGSLDGSFDDYDRTSRIFALGRGYVSQGKIDKGIELMDKIMHEWRRQGDVSSEGYAAQELMNVYSSLSMTDRLAALFPRYSALSDSLLNQEKLNSLIAADIKYHATQKEHENRLLKSQLELVHKLVMFERIALVLAVVLLILAIIYFVQRTRNLQRSRKRDKEHVQELLATQKHLNSRIEKLSGEITAIENREVVENVGKLLNPSVLSGDDEVRFRRSFAGLYPRYLPELRRLCPALTPNDELVCMLIYLQQTTDEIALCLGITRASVNSARFRIRRKLALPKEADLDAFLRSR